MKVGERWAQICLAPVFAKPTQLEIVRPKGKSARIPRHLDESVTDRRHLLSNHVFNASERIDRGGLLQISYRIQGDSNQLPKTPSIQCLCQTNIILFGSISAPHTPTPCRERIRISTNYTLKNYSVNVFRGSLATSV